MTFDSFDLDGDGVISRAEFKQALLGCGAEAVMAFQAQLEDQDGRGGGGGSSGSLPPHGRRPATHAGGEECGIARRSKAWLEYRQQKLELLRSQRESSMFLFSPRLIRPQPAWLEGVKGEDGSLHERGMRSIERRATEQRLREQQRIAEDQEACTFTPDIGKTWPPPLQHRPPAGVEPLQLPGGSLPEGRPEFETTTAAATYAALSRSRLDPKGQVTPERAVEFYKQQCLWLEKHVDKFNRRREAKWREDLLREEESMQRVLTRPWPGELPSDVYGHGQDSCQRPAARSASPQGQPYQCYQECPHESAVGCVAPTALSSFAFKRPRSAPATPRTPICGGWACTGATLNATGGSATSLHRRPTPPAAPATMAKPVPRTEVQTVIPRRSFHLPTRTPAERPGKHQPRRGKGESVAAAALEAAASAKLGCAPAQLQPCGRRVQRHRL